VRFSITLRRCVTASFFSATLLCFQQNPLPSWWFSSEIKAVMADPLFSALPISTRREILSQIDRKFAKMNSDKQDAFLWSAETTYLPKAPPPKDVFAWNATGPGSTSELLDIGELAPAIGKTVTARGLHVQASVDRKLGFFRCHLRIVNEASNAFMIQPRVFVLNVVKPKRYTLFFEYPSRVSYQLIKAGLHYQLGYTPTERTTVRSGTGRTIATIDAPDHAAEQEVKETTTSVSVAAFTVAGTIESKSLKEDPVAPGASVDGDVYFEQSDNAREVVLRVFISEYAFEIPFSTPKH
jgi:hypothetical protein